jgi:hypothetical protein
MSSATISGGWSGTGPAAIQSGVERASEMRKYAERRDDISRLMLAVMMQARNRLAREAVR